jgi:hypothetical protein
MLSRSHGRFCSRAVAAPRRHSPRCGSRHRRASPARRRGCANPPTARRFAAAKTCRCFCGCARRASVVFIPSSYDLRVRPRTVSSSALGTAGAATADESSCRGPSAPERTKSKRRRTALTSAESYSPSLTAKRECASKKRRKDDEGRETSAGGILGAITWTLVNEIPARIDRHGAAIGLARVWAASRTATCDTSRPSTASHSGSMSHKHQTRHCGR